MPQLINQTLVSILIPCYNAEKWLAETLESALSQTWTNTEIILVDDGSTDRSLSIAKKFESFQFKVIAQGENHGQTVALNRSLKEAQGNFIQYLDADDIIEPQKIEVQINKLLEEDSETLATAPWARFYYDDISTAKFVPGNDWKDFDDPIAWLVECWSGRGTMPPTSWLYPRSIVEKVGTWHENLTLNNDMEYFTRAVLVCRKIVFCPEAKWYYRSGNPSLSGQKSEKALWSQYEVIRLSTERLLAVENSDRTRYASACYWQYFVFVAYPNVPHLVKEAENRIAQLGGCNLRPEGGLVFRIIRDVLGWKVAMSLQKSYWHLRSSI